jgi:hypothetical protein
MKSRIHPALPAALFAVLALTSVTPPAHSDELVNVTCGARGQRPCLVVDNGWWRGGLRVDGCDRGLTSALETCYWDTWLGDVPYPCQRCRNFTRESIFDSLTNSFAAQALAEQRRLARNEPINWFTQVGSHNAFNAFTDGYIVNPNQRYSLTDQLNLGSRVLFLDTHELFTGVKLSHAQGDLGAVPTDRHVVMALREIREWIQAHPGAVIVLRFEDYWWDGDDGKHEFVQGLRNQLGPWILRVDEKPAGRWLSAAEMTAMGRQVVVMVDFDSRGGYFGDPPAYGSDIIFNQKLYSGGDKARNFTCSPEYRAPGEHFRTVWEDSLRWGPGGTLYDGCGDQNVFSDEDPPGAICPGTDTCNKNPWHTLPVEPEPACTRWVNVRDLVDCNVSTISLDQVGWNIWTGSPFATVPASPLAIFSDMIWSWEADHWGWREDNKAAVLSRDSRRWRAKPLGEQHPFACGYLREETGWSEGPSSDDTGPGTEWRITSTTGTWQEGGKACMDEFGGDGFLLSVPVNSLQNQQLLADMADADVDSVWLGYRDVDAAAGASRVDWQIDHGLGIATIDARPSPAFEGDRVAFDSKWTAAQVTPCAAALDAESWQFGDGSPAASSDSTVDTPGVGTQFTAWHTYSDNGSRIVRHSLPVACGQEPHARLQVINNQAPRMRIDCESWWSECSSQPTNDVRLFAGQPWTLQAAYYDAGAADTHTATIDWGDGNQEPATVTRDAQQDDGVTGAVRAQHTFMSCDSFAVDVELADDDGGRAIETVAVLVDEAAPVIACPPTVVVEGTSPLGAPATLGTPKVVGGYCGLETSHDGKDLYPYGTSVVHWVVRNVDATFDEDGQQWIRREASCTQQVKVVTRRCDFNRDGSVDRDDFGGLMDSLWRGQYREALDVNADGRYDPREFAVCFERINRKEPR